MPYAVGDAAITSDPSEQYRNSGFYEGQFKTALQLSNDEKIKRIQAILQIPITQKADDASMGVRKIAARFFTQFQGKSKDTIARENHRDELVGLFSKNKSNKEIYEAIDSFLNKEGMAGRYAACLLGLKSAVAFVAKQNDIDESDREMITPRQ